MLHSILRMQRRSRRKEPRSQPTIPPTSTTHIAPPPSPSPPPMAAPARNNSVYDSVYDSPPPPLSPPASSHSPSYDSIESERANADEVPPPYSRYASSGHRVPRSGRGSRRNSVSSNSRYGVGGVQRVGDRERRRTVGYYVPVVRRRVTADHPVWDMTVDEQVRSRRMGIDPVVKAEFMRMR